MKKGYLTLLIALVLLSVGVSALTVQNTPVKNIIISEIGNPIEYDITFDSEGVAQNIDMFIKYNGFTMDPSSNISVGNSPETLRVTVYSPSRVIKVADNYNVEYVVNGDQSTAVSDMLRIKVVDAKDAIKIMPLTLQYGDKVAKITIVNKINQTIDNLILSADSLFFKKEINLELAPFEEKTIELELDDGVSKLSYGKYIAEFEVNKNRSIISTDIEYVQKEGSELSKDVEGLIVRKTTLTRFNTGNVQIVGTIEASKDVFSRLFTVMSVEPNTQERKALNVNYVWSKELAPGEAYSVTLKTNYTLPVVLILLIIIVAVFVRIYLTTNILLEKSVSYVKTKGGEFALKVRVRVKARKFVENVEIIDRLPAMAQLYEKFGVKPDKIDSATKRLFWNVDRLNAGEERVFSYVIFSKVNVVGRFELPAASANYQKDGKMEQAISNRAFFVAETGI